MEFRLTPLQKKKKKKKSKFGFYLYVRLSGGLPVRPSVLKSIRPSVHHLPLYLSVRPSICLLSVYMCVYMLILLFVYPFESKFRPSVCLSACLPVCLSACLPVCLSPCLPVCQYACLPVCLLACLPNCLYAPRSVCLSIHLVVRSPIRPSARLSVCLCICRLV